MKEHPLSLLREELAVADATVRFWKKITMVAVASAMLCLSIAVVTGTLGAAYAQELRAYRQRCIDHDSASIVAGLSETLVKVNDSCFALHIKNIRTLEENFPGVFDTSEGRRLRYMYEVSDERREDVSIVPTSQAIGGVLQGEEQE